MGRSVDRLTALAGKPVRVSGYTRKDGTKVGGYIRYAVTQGQFKGKETPKRFVTAQDVQGRTVGSLGWFTDEARKGEIFHVDVVPDMQRQGIATELFRRAQADEKSLRHSEALSDDALAWIKGMKKG